MRQGERRVADRDRPGPQGRGRAVPRAGPERGVDGGDERAARRRPDAAARADAGPVLAVGRRQDDADPQPRCDEHEASLSCRSRSRRGTRRPSEIEGMHYRFIDVEDDFERHARPRRTAGMGRGARQLLRHAAQAGRAGAGRRRRTCCSTSTGRAPSRSSKTLPRRRRQRLHPAALDGRAEGAARAPRRGPARDDRQAARERARRDRALARSTTTCSSTTTSTAPSSDAARPILVAERLKRERQARPGRLHGCG